MTMLLAARGAIALPLEGWRVAIIAALAVAFLAGSLWLVRTGARHEREIAGERIPTLLEAELRHVLAEQARIQEELMARSDATQSRTA